MSRELIERVRAFPDVEIAEAFLNPDAYTPENLHIIEEEAVARGGREVLIERVRAGIRRDRLLQRALADVRVALAADRQPEEIVRSLAEKGIEGDDVRRMVFDAEAAHRRTVHEQTDTPRSMLMAVLNGASASACGSGFDLERQFRPGRPISILPAPSLPLKGAFGMRVSIVQSPDSLVCGNVPVFRDGAAADAMSAQYCDGRIRMRIKSGSIVALFFMTALAVAPWGAVLHAQCFDVSEGTICTNVVTPSDLLFNDVIGNTYQVSMVGSMVFSVTQVSETPCRVLFAPVQVLCTGVHLQLGTFTLTLDNTRTSTNCVVAPNQEGTPYPASTDVYAYLRLTIAAKPGVTYQSLQELHLTCGDVSTFCGPHVPNVYSVGGSVDFEDITNPGVVAFTLVSGYLRM